MNPIQNYNNYNGNHYKPVNRSYNSGNIQLLPEQTNVEIKKTNADLLKSYYLPSVNTITDPTLKNTINYLKEVKYTPEDIEHMKNIGVNLIFKDGNEAIKLLQDKKINVKFAPVDNPKIHAQWLNESNSIIINEKYKGTKNPAEILAISEAIFHEIGHAKDGDNQSSVQEELNCLALNTLANRYHQQKYPEVFESAQNADILNDGVCLYTKLFFDPDPEKKALKARIQEKYGDLPLETPNHAASDFAKSIKQNFNRMN